MSIDANVAFAGWAGGLQAVDKFGDEHDTAPEAFDRLKANEPSEAPAAPTRERFAHCVHCGLIANPEICPRCGRERDSGIKPLTLPSPPAPERPER